MSTESAGLWLIGLGTLLVALIGLSGGRVRLALPGQRTRAAAPGPALARTPISIDMRAFNRGAATP